VRGTCGDLAGSIGTWWSPHAPDRAIRGRYEITSSGGVEIELFDLIYGLDSSQPFDPRNARWPILRGKLGEMDVTLLDCILIDYDIDSRTQRISPLRALEGAGIDQPEDARFDWTEFRVTHLDSWLQRDATQRSFETRDGQLSIVIPLGPLPNLVAFVPGAEIRLVTQIRYEPTVRHQNVFQLKMEEQLSLDEIFFRYARPLRELIRLAAMEEVGTAERST
jgi:hypothetical protein